ncbi:MAG: uracil phosphoribosyltransferase [Bacteroidetes bacterium]|jgi:uracil phosphoribosyltransferase|nr:uracil phosphoribosyltransferase [Bacteroidota bacterium]MBK7041164.1 uracil phosphoribosyltransferase [Bacteroidota bacterium]MBK8328761.1 uracil phosphoribosyltransferase [Bacteroidota bacterium]MBK9302079.1 uracil phosphoribosyltransferase [Bacteroidota bacterium]HQW47338.1 uracil phosphoribosyltransferase [Chitinophagaceae bacterium]
MVHHLAKNNSLVNTWINELRDTTLQTDRLRFRKNLERIGEVIAYEISKTMPYQTTAIQTPLGIHQGASLSHEPVIATIFRAGFPLFQGVLNYFDKADCAFIAAYRKHHADGSFNIQQDYVTCPNLEGRTLIIADPMLATGASLIMALEELFEYGKPLAVHIVVTIACTEGIAILRNRYPDFTIWAADIDEELTAKGYIVPGLGDAGDLCFGTKLQM